MNGNMLEEKVRFWTYPISLIRLYEKRKINAEQMMLIGKIWSFDECRVSNAWLANWWGKSAHWVSESLTHLVKLGLIEVSISDGNRVIRVLVEAEPGCKKNHTPCGKNHRPRVEKPQGGVRKTTGDLNTYDFNTKNTAAGRHPAADCSIFHVNGEYAPFIKTCVSKFEDYLRLKRKILPGKRVNGTAWYEQFRLLLQDLEGDKDRLKTVLKRYMSLSHTTYTPVAECPATFRKKFLQIEKWTTRETEGPTFEEEKGRPPRYGVIVESAPTIIVS